MTSTPIGTSKFGEQNQPGPAKRTFNVGLFFGGIAVGIIFIGLVVFVYSVVIYRRRRASRYYGRLHEMSKVG